MPAVEVVPAPWTDAGVLARVGVLMRAAGHAPIMMNKEIDGFVMNRLQGALLQEAFRLVAEGHASTEDVDIGIRDGLGLRWSFMGPFETALSRELELRRECRNLQLGLSLRSQLAMS